MATSGYDCCRCGITLKLRLCARRNSFSIADHPGVAIRHSLARGLRALFSLERPQEIDDFLLLLSAQLIETFNDVICLAATAPVSSDDIYQVSGPSVMEEEDTLSDAPEGSCSELVGAGSALRDAIGEAFAHVVNEKVREKIHRLI